VKTTESNKRILVFIGLLCIGLFVDGLFFWYYFRL